MSYIYHQIKQIKLYKKRVGIKLINYLLDMQ